MADQLIRIPGSTWCILPFFECWGRFSPAPKGMDPTCTGIIRSGLGFRPPRRIRKALKMAQRRAKG